MPAFVEEFEEQSSGTTISLTNQPTFDGLAGTAPITFDSQLLYAGNSMKIVNSASVFRQPRATVTGGTWKERFFWRFSGFPVTNMQVATQRFSNANVSAIQLQSDGTIRLLKIAASVQTSGAVKVAQNTTYYIEYEMVAGTCTTRFYTADGATLLFTLTGTGFGTSIDQLGLGSAVADTSTFWYDSFQADPTTQPGYPASGPADAAYVWDGSALVACDCFVWDGTTLIPVDPYYWDGSTLV